MKPSHIAPVLVVCWALGGIMPAQQAEPGQFWIPAKVRWNHPRGSSHDETVASTIILYFSRNGVFAKDKCWVIRRGQTITISNGDPHNESVGSWDPITDGMHMMYRLVSRTVERKGEHLPGKEIEANAEMPQSGLKIGNQLVRSIMPTNAAEYAARYNALARVNAGSNQDTNSAR